MWKAIRKSILSGLIFQLFYELALAVTWITHNGPRSFLLTAAGAGIIIAFILCGQKIGWLVFSVFLGLLSAFFFYCLSLWAGASIQVWHYCVPEMQKFEDFTRNEAFAGMILTPVYLITSCFLFLVTAGILILRQMCQSEKIKRDMVPSDKVKI